MTTKTKRFFLPESEIPTQWYNIQADMVGKPMPPLNPATREPLKPSDLYPIFAKALADQELNQTDAWIDAAGTRLRPRKGARHSGAHLF